jgi:uncharacterized RDD family membrane protein YckC
MSPDDHLEDDSFDAPVDPPTAKPTSRLIPFPGTSRSTVPQWRKELGERVREVQERRAREAAAEAEEAERRRKERANLLPPPLELLPEAEIEEVNPIVAAALRRIERAHQTPAAPARHSQSATTDVAVASAVSGTEETDAPAVQRATVAAAAPAKITTEERASEGEQAPAPRARNLVVVPEAVPTEPAPDSSLPKPRRVISDDPNHPALSYLDSILSTGTEKAPADRRAPIFSRLTAAASDVVVVGFLSLPFAAILELQNLNWHSPRTLGLMAGLAAVVMFIYLTVATALTGRTLGMRLVSLRAIDAKTGLIPTGTQSATRALFYILSLATLGLGILYALIDADGKTVHDHFSRTAVVQA